MKDSASVDQFAAGVFPREDDLKSVLSHLSSSASDAIVIFDAGGRIVSWNEAASRLFTRSASEMLNQPLETISSQLSRDDFAALQPQQTHRRKIRIETAQGKQIAVNVNIAGMNTGNGAAAGWWMLAHAQTENAEFIRAQHSDKVHKLYEIATAIARDLDLEQLVQTVTDRAVDVCGAQFGAFFYNVENERGESYLLYALSGASREDFERFGLPRNTMLFEPTFRGLGVVRSDDIRSDPRYGRNGPYHGMPKGHLPVVSYLAVPVAARDNTVLGGLFFGHEKPGMFTKDMEELMVSIAVHAAIAIENATLHKAAQKEIEARRRSEADAQQLAAIVESSEDAILSKDLRGIIKSWNEGATRLFGYTAEEMVGESVNILIPTNRQDEEPAILSRIRAGERVDHYDTIRRRKDGSLIDISLTISPIRNSEGQIVGASKIARDISERRRAQDQMQLLLREMEHRIKNLFAVASSIATLSARFANTPQELETALQERLGALSRAYALTLSWTSDGTTVSQRLTSLHALLNNMLAAYEHPLAGKKRIKISGDDVSLSGTALTSIALLIHEFATNAAKYGALSTAEGMIDISCAREADKFVLTWDESGTPIKEPGANSEGFGSFLSRVTVKRQLGGDIVRRWKPNGLIIQLTMNLVNVTA